MNNVNNNLTENPIKKHRRWFDCLELIDCNRQVTALPVESWSRLSQAQKSSGFPYIGGFKKDCLQRTIDLTASAQLKLRAEQTVDNHILFPIGMKWLWVPLPRWEICGRCCHLHRRLCRKNKNRNIKSLEDQG